MRRRLGKAIFFFSCGRAEAGWEWMYQRQSDTTSR
jgi:hypothetical protein